MDSVHLSQTLRHSLKDWTDRDIAPYYLAIALGVAPDPGEKFGYWGDKKWVFWSNNPLGNALYEMVEKLANVGVLERNEEGFFRWNPRFDWASYNG